MQETGTIQYPNVLVTTCDCGMEVALSSQAWRHHVNSDEHAVRMHEIRQTPEYRAKVLREAGIS